MDEYWMLDYIHAVFPRWGLFESMEAAWAWVQEHDPENKGRYTPFKISVNRDLSHNVNTTCPEGRYANQR